MAAGPYAAFQRGRSFALVLDYGIPRAPLGRFDLEWHLAVVATSPSEESGLSRLQPSPGFGVPAMSVPSGIEEASALVVEVVPMARLRYAFVPGFALVVDGGVGVVRRSSGTRGRDVRRTLGGVEERDRRRAPGRTRRWSTSRRGSGSCSSPSPSAQLGADYSGFTPLLGLAYRL